MSHKKKTTTAEDGTEAPEAPEGTESEGPTVQTFTDVVAEIATATKMLTEAGLGGTDAGSLAYDVYVFYKSHICPTATVQPPAPPAE